MDIDTGVPLSSLPPRSDVATILCCNCGVPIDGTSAETFNALCHDCLKLTVDISDGIQREAMLHSCRDCDRWLSPPNQWIMAAPESRELLALCLRKLKGLQKSRIIDASFIWTEPHSRRVKVKISIQQEASAGAIIQQTFEVEFVVGNHQCPDCAKSYTHNTWRANVQVRQKVPHKRTFLYLEQLILKFGAHKDTINIKEVDNGIDFFFAARNSAEKFVDFLTSTVPVRMKKSQQLISMDVHTSVKSYKFNYSIELIPLCKDDLIALPIKLAKSLGNIAPLVLCYRVGTSVNLLDPNTLQTADLSTNVYWRSPFHNLADVRELQEFVVMDMEPTGVENGKFIQANATVRRAADFGVNDTEFVVRTHMGAVLNPGDSAMGYYITGTNFNSPELEAIEESKQYKNTIQDVVLVKKVYPSRKKNKNRNWRLRRMEREEGEMKPRKQDEDKEAMDYEQFLRDVEEDPELQEQMNLYRSQQAQQQNGDAEMMDEEEGDDDDGLEIPMDRLQEEFEEMTMNG